VSRHRRTKRERDKPSCPSGKVCFASQGSALRALDRIRKDNAQAVAPVEEELVPKRAYRCETCGYHHLTSKGAGT
jgi:hypothetical protein